MDLVLDNGLLRVGRRDNKSAMPIKAKQFILLPYLLLEDMHEHLVVDIKCPLSFVTSIGLQMLTQLQERSYLTISSVLSVDATKGS